MGPRQAQFGHQRLPGAAGHLDALAVNRQPHFAGTVNVVVGGVDPVDVVVELAVADLPTAGLMVELVVVGRWGDRYIQLGKLGADLLDAPAQTIRAVAVALMLSDEPGDQCVGRSISREESRCCLQNRVSPA